MVPSPARIILPFARSKFCPFNGLCRRCRHPGHVAKECTNAWANPRPAPPAAPAAAAATEAVNVSTAHPPGSAAASAAADAEMSDAVGVVLPRSASSEDVSVADPPGAAAASAVADAGMSDVDYVPPSDVESDAFLSVEEVASGDEEVVAAAQLPPSAPLVAGARADVAKRHPPSPVCLLIWTSLTWRVLITSTSSHSVRSRKTNLPGRKSVPGRIINGFLLPYKSRRLLLFFSPPGLFLLLSLRL